MIEKIKSTAQSPQKDTVVLVDGNLIFDAETLKSQLERGYFLMLNREECQLPMLPCRYNKVL